ncbi:MAG: hypothetical protein JKY42_08860 [Flavobacteriales bacterium]|nr:hypothetical protein [Flavobacteriales bacterium]
MYKQMVISLIFLFVIVGCYSFATVITTCETDNNPELVNFPFDSEEQEEESKKGKEKEKENDEDTKELVAHQLATNLQQLLLNQKRKGFYKHYTSIFVEIFTPPPEHVS